MQDFLSTVTWVAPLILTIFFSGVIPIFVHWHKISRIPTVKLLTHKTGRDLGEYAVRATVQLDGGEKSSVWYRVSLKNMDSSPLLLKRVVANKSSTAFENYDYVMQGEEMLISFSQDLTKKDERVLLDSFAVVVKNKDARFRITVAVDNSGIFPTYAITNIKYVLY